MNPARPTFAVIYRWRIRDGHEDRFQRAWATLTEALKARRGALGSRVHQGEDGLWIAYAQWPDRDAWAASRESGSVDEGASATMAESVAESFAPITLDVVRDHLTGG